MQVLAYGNNTTLACWAVNRFRTGITLYANGTVLLTAELVSKQAAVIASFFGNIPRLNMRGLYFFYDTLYESICPTDEVGEKMIEALDAVYREAPSLMRSGAIVNRTMHQAPSPSRFDALDDILVHNIRMQACLMELKERNSNDDLRTVFRMYNIKAKEANDRDRVKHYLHNLMVVEGFGPGDRFEEFVAQLHDDRMEDMLEMYEQSELTECISSAIEYLQAFHAGVYIQSIVSALYSDDEDTSYYDDGGRSRSECRYANCIAQRIIPKDLSFDAFQLWIKKHGPFLRRIS